MGETEKQAAVGRAYTAVASAKKKVMQLENRRHDIVVSLANLSEIDPSKIILNDQGVLVGLKPAATGNYTTAKVPDFPSSSEIKRLIVQLKDAERVLAEAESELSQLSVG